MRRLKVAWTTLLLLAACGEAEPPPPPAAGAATVVHAVRAEKRTVYSWVFGQGTAVAVRRKALYFQLEGKVSYVARGPNGGELRPGDPVEGPAPDELLGQLIAKVDDRDVLANVEANRAELQRTQGQWLSSEAQLKTARAELEAAERDLATAQSLLKSGTGTQNEVDNAQTRVSTARSAVDSAKSGLRSAKSGAKAQKAQVKRSEIAQERAGIFAPFDGVVAAINIKEGDYNFGAQVSPDPGQQLRTAPVVVIDPSQFEIEVELPAYEAAQVRVGQPAFVLTGQDVATLSQANDPAVRPEALVTRGSVFAVSPSVDPSARSILVKVRVHQRPERLRDGEFASCFILTESSEDAIAVPFNAFIREDEHSFAFVVPEGGDKAERRELTLGLSGVDRAEIVRGLAKGELVVTRGRRSLGDGSRVDVARIGDEDIVPDAPPPQPEAKE